MIDLVDFQPLLFLGIRVLKGCLSLYSATLPAIFTPHTQRFARNCLFLPVAPNSVSALPFKPVPAAASGSWRTERRRLMREDKPRRNRVDMN